MFTAEHQEVGFLCEWKEGQAHGSRSGLRADAAINFSTLNQTRGGKLSQRDSVVASDLVICNSILPQQVVQQATAACTWLTICDANVPSR